jgi:hypothetical protein
MGRLSQQLIAPFRHRAYFDRLMEIERARTGPSEPRPT